MTPKVKWILLALSLSLMANVFAAGHFFGERRPQPGQGGDNGGAWVSRLLPGDVRDQIPKEAREAFRRNMLGNRHVVRQARADLREARKGLMEALRRDSVDQAALEAAFANVRAGSAALQSSFESSLAAALATMTPEQRVEVAKRMKRRGDRWKGRRGQGERPPPPAGGLEPPAP